LRQVVLNFFAKFLEHAPLLQLAMLSWLSLTLAVPARATYAETTPITLVSVDFACFPMTVLVNGLALHA
jgi:hypothetical protein